MNTANDSCQTSRRDFIKLAGVGAGVTVLGAGAHRVAAANDAAPAALTGGRVPPYRVGRWLPSDQAILDRWVAAQIRAVEANPQPFHPVIQEFQELIEGDPELYMLFHMMFEQIPQAEKFNKDPMGRPQVRDYKQMLALINAVLTTAPSFNKTDLVGFPINAILDWPMGTEGGFAAFLNPKVNAQFKKVLNAWATFLNSADSCYVLNDDPHTGWFGADAQAAIPNFVEEFECDPEQPYYGFTSWDDFFTRTFRPGQRPVGDPDNLDIIVNACESAPYALVRDVKFYDAFWIKGQPYSLRHMFANDPVAEQFVGGTVYQAFLNALSYHRWHSPVDGTIAKVDVIDGTYYSEPPALHFDEAAPNESQGYITEVATRAIVQIEADNPKIGRMAFMAVGMAEVSTCDVTVYVGQHVKKGEQTGMFHFGGSTHCLIFRPGVELEFDLGGQEPGLEASRLPINAAIAKVQG
jgi:phosphatidylserine decarboxylase